MVEKALPRPLLTLMAGGELIVPIRAIAYMLGLSPRDIAAAVADGREDPVQRVFETHFHPGYIDSAGVRHDMSHFELLESARRVADLHERNAPKIEQIAAMPAGVYVPLSDLKSVASEMNSVSDGSEWDSRYTITINESPLVSFAERELILEGFEPLRWRRRRVPRGFDPTAAQASHAFEDLLKDRDWSRGQVQAIAKDIWRTNPRFTIKQVCAAEGLKPFVGYWNGAHTISDWVGEVDPRKIKAGRRRKK